MTTITFCSKSTWEPAMRREHALTRIALQRGVDVTFVETPSDARSIGRTGPRAFLRSLRGEVRPGGDGVPRIVERTTLVPGHRARAAEWIDISLMRRILAQGADDVGTTICNLPWQWRATQGRRFRVFDCADDWTRLLPSGRSMRLAKLFQKIADEADAIIVASPDLVDRFGGRNVSVVPNGADAASIPNKASGRPGSHSLVYIGTFSERFDTEIVSRLMRAQTQYRLDLYGPCRYAGSSDRPATELLALLAAFPERVRWHGTIGKEAVPGAIDRADVVIIPNRPGLSEGQSSMKLFDSAARGRPAVVSAGVSCLHGGAPPGTYFAQDGDEWADAIDAAETESPDMAASRITWARANTWDSRWPLWARSAFGHEPNGALVA